MRILIANKTLQQISAVLVAALVILTAFAIRPSRSAQAFFPTNLLAVGGALGRSHIRITGDAIKELDQEFFGITKLTKAMKKAIEQIGDANAEVDDDQTTSAKHFVARAFLKARPAWSIY